LLLEVVVLALPVSTAAAAARVVCGQDLCRTSRQARLTRSRSVPGALEAAAMAVCRGLRRRSVRSAPQLVAVVVNSIPQLKTGTVAALVAVAGISTPAAAVAQATPLPQVRPKAITAALALLTVKRRIKPVVVVAAQALRVETAAVQAVVSEEPEEPGFPHLLLVLRSTTVVAAVVAAPVEVVPVVPVAAELVVRQARA